MPRSRLWNKLRARGLGGSLLRAVQALYADVLNLLQQSCQQWGLRVNTFKAKLLPLSGWRNQQAAQQAAEQAAHVHLRLFSSLVYSVLSYGAEVWGMQLAAKAATTGGSTGCATDGCTLPSSATLGEQNFHRDLTVKSPKGASP